MEPHSDDEFLGVLRRLIERLCDQRHFSALARILPGYLAFNGLTDGWHHLFDALKATRGLGYEAFSQTDWEVLNDLIHAADIATRSRS